MEMQVLQSSLSNALNNCARACRILEMEGHGDMVLGHLSLRDPDGRGFWMKRSRAGLGEILGPNDFVLIDWDGNQISGSGSHHSEWPIHSEILRVRDDIQIVVHSHPFYTSVFSASDVPLQPYTLAADYFVDVPRHLDEVALVTTKEEGTALAKSLGNAFAVLMANHGVTFCGTSIEHAVCVGVFLEQACKVQLVGMSVGLGQVNLDRRIRARRHSQINHSAHWDHCWNYFCRKLASLEGNSGPKAIFG